MSNDRRLIRKNTCVRTALFKSLWLESVEGTWKITVTIFRIVSRNNLKLIKVISSACKLISSKTNLPSLDSGLKKNLVTFDIG